MSALLQPLAFSLYLSVFAMNWITPTINDVYDYAGQPVVDQIITVLQGSRTTSPLPGIITKVVLEFRGRVAKCNQLDANPAAVPGCCLSRAAVVIYCRLKMAAMMQMEKEERSDLAEAGAFMERVEKGQSVVEPPDNPLAANFDQALPSPSFGKGRPREFTRASQDG